MSLSSSSLLNLQTEQQNATKIRDGISAVYSYDLFSYFSCKPRARTKETGMLLLFTYFMKVEIV